jgi:hypothetical protein
MADSNQFNGFNNPNQHIRSPEKALLNQPAFSFGPGNPRFNFQNTGSTEFNGDWGNLFPNLSGQGSQPLVLGDLQPGMKRGSDTFFEVTPLTSTDGKRTKLSHEYEYEQRNESGREDDPIGGIDGSHTD